MDPAAHHPASLANLIEQTIDALSILDAETLEKLAVTCHEVERPGSGAEWRRCRSRHQVLRLLLSMSARQLAILGHGSVMREDHPALFHAFAGIERHRPATGGPPTPCT